MTPIELITSEVNIMMSGVVLVLNASYEPIHVCNLRRAITLIHKGVAVCEEAEDALLRSPTMAIAMPDVIRLKSYVKLPVRKSGFSRKHVFVRDGYRCQYCAKKYPASELTVDHIIPRSKGGKYEWENVATACKSCNSKKADFFLDEINMKLLRKPKPPSRLQLHLHSVRAVGSSKESWKKYLWY